MFIEWCLLIHDTHYRAHLGLNSSGRLTCKFLFLLADKLPLSFHLSIPLFSFFPFHCLHLLSPSTLRCCSESVVFVGYRVFQQESVPNLTHLLHRGRVHCRRPYTLQQANMPKDFYLWICVWNNITYSILFLFIVWHEGHHIQCERASSQCLKGTVHLNFSNLQHKKICL